MRTFTLVCSALLLGTTALRAQTVATFDDLVLPHADTFYVNYAASGTDVGFNDGLAHFPCVYDTSYGGFWSSGFAYSNMRDSFTSGFTNQYSAKTDTGYGPSANYAVAYGEDNYIKLVGAANGQPVSGFYVTNNTYAANSMRDGDMFARKFHNGDWFKLTVHGYLHGAPKTDSASVYLADFLFPDTSMNYISNTWQWVNLLPLGDVDSLDFSLSSTDNGSFGMNTPAYFCIDNFTTHESSLVVSNTQAPIAKVYPNPAKDMLYVDITDNSVQTVTVLNMAGQVIGNYTPASHIEINTSSLPAGTYLLQMTGNKKTATSKFIKQ